MINYSDFINHCSTPQFQLLPTGRWEHSSQGTPPKPPWSRVGKNILNQRQNDSTSPFVPSISATLCRLLLTLLVRISIYLSIYFFNVLVCNSKNELTYQYHSLEQQLVNFCFEHSFLAGNLSRPLVRLKQMRQLMHFSALHSPDNCCEWMNGCGSGSQRTRVAENIVKCLKIVTSMGDLPRQQQQQQQQPRVL